MELPSKLLEQIAHNTRSRIEEHILVVMDKSSHEEHLSQQLKTSNNQFKVAVTFLTRYNGVSNVTNSNEKFYFINSITDKDGYLQITMPPGAYEIENSNIEIKSLIIEEGHYTELNYPFTIKPIFSTLGSFIELSIQGPVITFVPDDSIGDLLAFNKTTIYEEYNLSTNPVDILPFDNIFLECNIAQGMIFENKRSGIFQNFTLDVDPGYKNLEKFVVQCNGI